jgi:CDP-diacylglycerol---glycerol-3-phosphate 3-phosphatidyltransferase
MQPGGRRSLGSLWTTPNVLSLLRVAIVPLVVYLLTAPGRMAGLLAAGLIILASVTDYLDGYLARKQGIVTTIGKFLDPLADKLLVVSVLIMLTAMPCVSSAPVLPCPPRVPAWVVVVIVGRELAVTALRSMAMGEGVTLGAENLGKYKTIFQMFALVGLLVHYRYLYVDFQSFGMYFLWIALLLGLWSGVDYAIRFGRQLATMPARPSED